MYFDVIISPSNSISACRTRHQDENLKEVTQAAHILPYTLNKFDTNDTKEVVSAYQYAPRSRIGLSLEQRLKQ